ncbi:deoxyribose-phosphate aldolase, partial [Candidatus Micrarchaeota archaeon]|nr:deoxyribose-phosphate aldolase [Candidatus Micrarchaeota archaeon]
LLTPTVGFEEASLWMEANAQVGFAALCVSPFLLPLAVRHLAGTGTVACSVAGFPFGYAQTDAKAAESARLVESGCREVDMVMNIAAFLEGEYAFVEEDISAVVTAVREASDGEGIVKVILETGYLDPSQIAEASRLAVDSGADFVKTSTGFGPRGASIEDVRVMRETVGQDIGVKAAGGIRDASTALAMIEAGATRVGASSGREILDAFDAGRV